MIAAITLNASLDRRYVLPEVKSGGANRVQQCACSAGGKGLNVARVIHQLGQPVVASGLVGGFLGQCLTHLLDGEGIRHRFATCAEETRCCINVIDQRTGVQTEFLEPGMQVTEAEYARFLAVFDELCGECDVIALSGSLPRGVPGDAYAALIRRARQAGKKVLLDTSGAALQCALEQSAPFLVKPNEHELAALTGCDAGDEAQVAQAACALHARGIEQVVVSLGSRGALMVCREGVIRGKPPAIEAANTVGCGDSMIAALAVAAEQGMAAMEAMRFAIAVSAASALSPGTGGLNLEDYRRVAPQVEVWAL